MKQSTVHFVGGRDYVINNSFNNFDRLFKMIRESLLLQNL